MLRWVYLIVTGGCFFYFAFLLAESERKLIKFLYKRRENARGGCKPEKEELLEEQQLKILARLKLSLYLYLFIIILHFVINL